MELKQCNVCKSDLPANTDHFYRRSASHDGLSYTCKNCTLQRSNTFYEANRSEPKRKPHDGFRICSLCKRELILSNFYRYFRKDRIGKVYYSSQCKACSSAYHKKHYSRPKNAQYKALAKQLAMDDNPYARIPSTAIPATTIERPTRGRPRSGKNCEPIYLEAERKFQELKTVTLPDIPGLY